MKNLTWQQALVLAACLAAPIVAYKLLGSMEAAGATMVVGMVVNFLLGRGDPPAPPPSPSNVVGFKVESGEGPGPVARRAVVALCLPGCIGLVEAKDPTDELLAKCRSEAFAGHYLDGKDADEAMAIYEACLKREGVK